jgi:hypothetical protein
MIYLEIFCQQANQANWISNSVYQKILYSIFNQGNRFASFGYQPDG